MEEMAEPVHFIPQQSQLTSPTFDHTRCSGWRTPQRPGYTVTVRTLFPRREQDRKHIGAVANKCSTELVEPSDLSQAAPQCASAGKDALGEQSRSGYGIRLLFVGAVPVSEDHAARVY